MQDLGYPNREFRVSILNHLKRDHVCTYRYASAWLLWHHERSQKASYVNACALTTCQLDATLLFPFYCFVLVHVTRSIFTTATIPSLTVHLHCSSHRTCSSETHFVVPVFYRLTFLIKLKWSRQGRKRVKQ